MIKMSCLLALSIGASASADYTALRLRNDKRYNKNLILGNLGNAFKTCILKICYPRCTDKDNEEVACGIQTRSGVTPRFYVEKFPECQSKMGSKEVKYMFGRLRATKLWEGLKKDDEGYQVVGYDYEKYVKKLEHSARYPQYFCPWLMTKLGNP